MLAKKAINQVSIVFSRSSWLIVIAFAILGLIGILNHSMWRDELNPWLIVRDSESFRDLITNIKYEGHPVLWYFSLALMRRIADHPVSMQILHWGITVTAIAIFYRYSPFSDKHKLLFIFGYFPFYEYLIISRNYVFSLLFVFAFCAAFPSRKKTYLYLSILLGLLANSSAFALLVSVCLSLTLLVEFCCDRDQRKQYFEQSKKYDLFVSIGIIIASLILSAYIIIPPADSYLHGGLNNGWGTDFEIHQLLKSINRIFASYFLILPYAKRIDSVICAFIILLILVLTLIKLSKKPFPFFFYLVGNCVLLAFTYLRFAGQHRHFGHFYLVLIAALWLERYYEEHRFLVDKLSIKPKLFNRVQRWHHVVLTVILFAQLLGGIYRFTADFIVPFSASRDTAYYIQKNQLDREFIVASRDANMAALAGYLDRKFYYPERQKMGSFTLFKQGRKEVDPPEILRQLHALQKTKILLILNKKWVTSSNGLRISPIQSFEKSFISDERYHLYWVEKQ